MKAYKPINFRAFAVIALFVIVTVFAVYIYALNHAAGIAVGVITISASAALFVVALVKHIRKSAKLRFCLTFGLSVVLCVLAMSLGCDYANFRESVSDLTGYHSVYGRVCEIGVGNTYRVLDKLEIDGKRVNGKLNLNVKSDDYANIDVVRCGDRVYFDGYLTVGDFIYDDKSVNGYSVRTGIVFYGSINADSVIVSFEKSMPIKNFLYKINRLLVDNMGDKYGNLAYAMLTGDKSGLGEEIQYFRAAGLGHIMAVSGLHIGFFVMLLNFVLGKVDKRVRYPIILAVLFAYMTVADFSPSVVRAFVMAAVAMLSFAVGGRRDILSSLCCAASLILAFKPFYLFEVGFVLSFGAIFGIAMFAAPIKRALTKAHVHGKIADSVGASVSVQAGLVPAQIAFFNEIPLFAPIVNMVLIPYISVVFIVILVSLPIAAIPGLGAVLKAGMYLLMPIDAIAQGIANVPFITFSHYATPAVFCCYPVMFFASGFFMMPRGKGKISIAFAALYTCIALCAVPYPPPSDFLCAVNGTSTESVVYCDGKTYIIGYAADKYGLRGVLDANRLHKIDELYLLGTADDTFDTVMYLNEHYELGVVYGNDAGETGYRLKNNGIDYRLTDDGNAVKTVRVAGEFVGYEFCDILFAADGADEIGYMHYSYIRAKYVKYTRDGVTYYCNKSYDDEPKGEYHTLQGYNYYIDLCEYDDGDAYGASSRLSAFSAV